MVSTHKNRCCSFCGKGQDEVKTLLAAPKGVFICDQCVKKFHQKDTKKEDK